MATVVVSADKVQAACLETIRHIEAVRLKNNEDLIDKVMTTEHGWFFWKYYPTREQAVKILDETDGYRWFGWRSEYAWGDLQHARKLLTLAKVGDPVALNEEDCRVIF